jgi:hypothetical protein
VHFYRHILEDYDRLQFGYEAINLISRASEDIDEPDWYGVLSEVYMGLDAQSVPLQLTQSWFYLHYAELTGYELNLSVVRDLKDMCSERLVRFMNDAKDDASINAAQFGLMYGTTDELQVSQLVSMIGVTQASYEIQDDSTLESNHTGALDHVCEHK